MSKVCYFINKDVTTASPNFRGFLKLFVFLLGTTLIGSEAQSAGTGGESSSGEFFTREAAEQSLRGHLKKVKGLIEPHNSSELRCFISYANDPTSCAWSEKMASIHRLFQQVGRLEMEKLQTSGFNGTKFRACTS